MNDKRIRNNSDFGKRNEKARRRENMNQMEKISGGFFTGINYWGLKDATQMWEKYDAASVEEDMKALRGADVTHLRVFPLWPVFQPLTALYTSREEPFEYRFGEEPLPDTDAGRAGVSEEACRRFENFCALAEKHGLKLIVGLITGHMSFRNFAPPAFAGRRLVGDPTVLKWQLRFVRYFVRRFRGQTCIAAWDLGNEVNNMITGGVSDDDFYVWCSAIADAARACDGSRPIVSGLDASNIEKGATNLVSVREICDIHTCHPYNIFSTNADPLPSMKPILDLAFKCRMYEDVAGIPTFAQEFGSIGYLNCSRKTEADFYRASLYACLSHGCHGVMWWCAFDQGHLRFAPYEWNNIGSDYGFFDRERRSKPLVDVNRLFHELLDKLPGGKLPPHSRNGVILVPRDDGDADVDKLRAAFLLGKRANLDLSFSYALEAIPDAPLYILPSISFSKSLPARRLDAIMRRVEEGAVLYLSMDAGLFRMIPELTGVQAAWREQISTDMALDFRGASLPVSAPCHYVIESVNAEVLARNEAGEPVFFMKRHGRGRVYFLLAPLEKYLGGRPGAFWREDEPAYDLIYRELAGTAGIERIADSSSPFVRLTEHRIDEKSAYIVAVNYSPYPQNACITAKNGRLEWVHGAKMTGNTLVMEPNDGAVYLFHAQA